MFLLQKIEIFGGFKLKILHLKLDCTMVFCLNRRFIFILGNLKLRFLYDYCNGCHFYARLYYDSHGA